MSEKGNISIHAQNIMPIIKQWLYSDKDIFLRELVSNGCDAIVKRKHLALQGEADAPEAYRVDVVADGKAGTLTISDNGIGMTADEVKRFIAQVAFSGAEEFLAKYKTNEGDKGGIIGHFGLGFYSAFMVAKKVVIDTKRAGMPDAEAVRWESEDGMAYEMSPSARTEAGTTITLYLNEEDLMFAQTYTLRDTLDKYCAFMPTPIYVSEIKPAMPQSAEANPADGLKDIEETEDGEVAEADAATAPAAPEQVNDPTPLWMKMPNDCTPEEYKAFYHKVFRDYEDPLFWIHLNAEFPFNLKGILYFPKLKNEFAANEGVIKLYNNQVFVADNIKEVIPEFLMLLKGVIDCPELPLNVSRSFLQNDGYVKKMNAYITRKVADRLVNEFTTQRTEYQTYWDDIHPFVKYGCGKDDKFFERVKSALLFKTTKGEYLTAKEYMTRNYSEDTEADKRFMYYTSDEKRQAQMIELFTAQDKDVVVMDTLVDTNFMSFMEYAEKDDQIHFRRVDAGTDGLTEATEADETQRKALETTFRKVTNDDTLEVALSSFKADDLPAMITVDEQMRRYAEMSKQWGMSAGIPEKRTLTLNEKHPLVKYLVSAATDDDQTQMICEQLVDLAEMARQPLVEDRMVNFLKRSNQLLTQMVQSMSNT